MKFPLAYDATTTREDFLRLLPAAPGATDIREIEHRMFCHITANWRGRPLASR